MINKQGLLFLTLTSLILVLSVYYITMPNELLLTTNSNYKKPKDDSDIVNVSVDEADTILAMQNILNSERLKLTEELNDKLVKEDLTIEEKNNIYEELKYISKIESLEDKIEQRIKEQFSLDSFVKIKEDVVEVTINSSKHDKNLVVKIIACVEGELENKMYVSVSFKE